MSTSIVKTDRGVSSREEFGSTEVKTQAELAVAAVTAREEAVIKAEYIMAERHPRVWMDIRTAMLEHCERYGFAVIARYAKPVGKKPNGHGGWEEVVARGFSSRFAETLAQEMGHVKPFTHVAYEDDLIRVLRIGVTDLQKNLPRSREVTFAKAVEKKGYKDRQQVWHPPEGRELISQRLNTYNEPVYLVKATDDEMRNKVNSEESKSQRDFILKLCPRDILDECEARIGDVIKNKIEKDPQGELKNILDRFRQVHKLMPSDLEKFIGKPCDKFSSRDLLELVDLGNALKQEGYTFEQALKAKSIIVDEEGQEVAGSAKAAESVGDQKVADLRAAAAARKQPPAQTDAGAPAPKDWGALANLEEWPEDPFKEELGTRIVVQGKRYERAAADADSWKEVVAAEAQDPILTSPDPPAPKQSPGPLPLGRGKK